MARVGVPEPGGQQRQPGLHVAAVAVAFASGLAEYGLAGRSGLAPVTSLVLGMGTLSGLLLGAAGLLAIIKATPSSQASPRRDHPHLKQRPGPL